MKTYIVIFILVTIVSSCAKNDGCIELEGGYRLWLVSANERYITYADNVYFLGPRIDEIAEYGSYVFGVNSEQYVQGLKNIPGYFFIDTANGSEHVGLDKKQFINKIMESGIKKYEMVGPGILFEKKRRNYSCN